MGCSQGKNDSQNKPKEKVTGGSNSPVARSKSTMELFMTHKERASIRNDSSISDNTKLLLSPPFCNFSAITKQVYLTGIGGITLDNLKKYNIKCLVNVAAEIASINIPRGQPPSLVYHKFPVS